MKNQILDRYSSSSPLRTRFEEILGQVGKQELPRMDGGDQIGQLIVANLEALPKRASEESALLFEAQKCRAKLYWESSGATALEAAESLIAARETLAELNHDHDGLISLLEPARGIFEDLVAIGSKRNAWLCLEIIISCLRVSPEHKELIPEVLGEFAEFSRDMIHDGREPGLLSVILDHCDWARECAPDRFPELVCLVPMMLDQCTEDLPWQDVLRAYLYARHLSLGFGPGVLESIARKMAGLGKIDTEVRVVYQDFLSECGDRKFELETEFKELAYVNPATDIAYNADLDSLNSMFSEHYPEQEWVWRNRALLSRRHGDRAGALVFLSRAMSINGEPPQLMGLMAPVLAGMGFLQTAFQFARFASKETNSRFALNVLRLLAAEPANDSGRQKLQLRLEKTLLLENLPIELRSLILNRRAELLFHCGDFETARGLYTEIFGDNLSDEIAAVRLAEMAFASGETRKLKNYLSARFTPRVLPFVENIHSQVAEQNGDLDLAWEHNEKALALMPEAQMAGRQEKDKTLRMLEDRIRATFGESHVQCSLMAMLEVETHAPPHRDLLDLEDRLQRRSVDLGIIRGDVEGTATRIRELVSREMADTDVFLAGARASLDQDRADDALELLDQAEASGHDACPEIRLLRAKTYLAQGDLEQAAHHFRRELEIGPSAEARLFAAMIDLEGGHEEAALETLEAVREEDGGSAAVQHEIAYLKGVLFERKGRNAEAHKSYLAAVGAMGGESQAATRAGILGLEMAMDDDGSVIDPLAAEEAIVLLESNLDSNVVCRVALARASQNCDVDAASSELERAMQRTNAVDELRLRRAHLNLLLANERTEAALDAMNAMTDIMEPENLGRHHGRIAELSRQCALQEIVKSGNLDSERVQSWLGSKPKIGKKDPVHELLSSLLDPTADEPVYKKNASPALFLASAVAGGQRKKDGKLRAQVLADGAKGIAAAEAKNILMVLQEGSAAQLLDAIDSFDAAELTLPWARLDVLAVVAAKAALEGDDSLVKEVSSRAPGRFREHEKLKSLIDMISSGGADTSRVLSLLCDLSGRLLNSDSDDHEGVLLSVRTSVTELRETPSPSWASARLRCAGKRTKTHEKAAEVFWKSVRDRGEDESGVALHHLALMSMSKAHGAELHGAESMELWRETHELWAELIDCSPFWATFVEALPGEDTAVVVSSLREKIAGWILHSQVVLAKRRLFAGELPRAIEHARLAAQSKLRQFCDPTFVHEAIFDALSGELERFIHKGKFEEAMACIDHVIVADPGNPMAMREMVMVSASCLERNLVVVDSLTKLDPSMMREISGMMSTVLLSAERSIRELAERGCQDPQLAKALVAGLRSVAFVAQHRDCNTNEACVLLDRAIEVADANGIDSQKIRHVRSDLGLGLVEETMSRVATSVHEIQSDAVDPLDAAMDEVDRLIALDPGNIKVITQKARLLLVAHRDAEAEELARDMFKDAQKKNEPSLVRSAVELMHQVQSEREKLRYESKMELVDRLCADDNWRAALDLFKEAVVGRENEPLHLLKHVDILIGLRKLDRAETMIDSLEDCDSLEREWQVRRARLACIRHMKETGGDLLSAFELAERRNFEKAIVILDELLGADSRSAPLQYLAAKCHQALGSTERTSAHADAASRCAKRASDRWIRVLIDEEIQS